jgi:hypothetical protein
VNKIEHDYNRNFSDYFLLRTSFVLLQSSFILLIAFFIRMFVVVVVSKAVVGRFVNISLILLIAVLIDVVKQSNLVEVFFHLTNHVGDEWWLHFLTLKTAPLELIEKSVLFNFTSA